MRGRFVLRIEKTKLSFNRRKFIGSLAAVAGSSTSMSALSARVFPMAGPGATQTGASASSGDYHGYAQQNFVADGCAAHLVRPDQPLVGSPWVWRTMFWDAFPMADLALLKAGFHLAFIDVGNTFGCPDAMKHFDAFYAVMTRQYGLSARPALEGLSRGGLYAYRWAYVNTDKVGCIYGDAPVCDMKSRPGGKGKGRGSPADWQEAIRDYHFSGEQEMMAFKGNPIDILAPIAAAHIPILHVCGDADKTVPEDENTDIVRARYMALGGSFALIVKEGCDHHPHGLTNPTPIVDFIVANCAQGKRAEEARRSAPRPGSVTRLAPGQW
jgi:pimeloyl-ACP methyl ester carboxylesterase